MYIRNTYFINGTMRACKKKYKMPVKRKVMQHYCPVQGESQLHTLCTPVPCNSVMVHHIALSKSNQYIPYR